MNITNKETKRLVYQLEPEYIELAKSIAQLQGATLADEMRYMLKQRAAELQERRLWDKLPKQIDITVRLVDVEWQND